MSNFFFKKLLSAAVGVLVLWVAVKYLLPVALPFLLGAAVALLAEPLVQPVSRKLNRTAAAVVGVGLTLGVLAGAVLLVGAMAVQQMGRLAQGVPQLADTAQQALTAAQHWLTTLSEGAPAPIRPLVQQTATAFFSDGSVLIQQLTQRLPGALTTAIGTVGNGVLGLGVGALSAFLISIRLPKLKAYISGSSWIRQVLPAVRRIRASLGGWLKAQIKLCAVTWGIVTVGFLILGIPNALLWAAAVALVDAIPILGTGTVLVPWAVVCLLRSEALRAIGLLCTYGAAFMARTVLEPRLVGDQLGLDPLTTLGALYVGYRFWGFPGLVLTPILASAVKSLITAK